MNSQSPSTRGPWPVTPRRPSTSSGDQRPSTSGGERIEPTSLFLREALRERSGLPSRARSTTPRRVKPGQRSQAYKDEWLQSSGDDITKPKAPTVRPTRPRRASDLSVAKGSPSVMSNSTTRELEAKMDQLQKENWDLKHRIMLYQERSKKTNLEMEEKDQEIERLQQLEHTSQSLEAEVTSMKDTNRELTIINEELVAELERSTVQHEQLERDAEGRQNAIEEAAAIIQALESRLHIMEDQMNAIQQSVASPQTDSDYFSGDTKPLHQIMKPSPSLLHTPHLGPDSDYHSADTSPLITPVSTRKPSAENPSPPQLRTLKEQSSTFNRELGIHFVTSKDSLFSMFLEKPDLPSKSASSGVNRLRTLRKRADAGKSSLSRSTDSTSSLKPKPASQNWFAKPLRNLYMTGESGTKESKKAQHTLPAKAGPYMEVVDQHNEHKARSNPSISVFQSDPRSTSTETILRHHHHHRSNSVHARPLALLTRNHSTPPRVHTDGPINTSPQRISTPPQPPSPVELVPSTYAAPSAQTAPTYSSTKPTTQTHRVAPPPNLAFWPRRYPAWPPSAGLRDRDLLFHGDESDGSPSGSPTEELPSVLNALGALGGMQ
jgi:hypothetical protein